MADEKLLSEEDFVDDTGLLEESDFLPLNKDGVKPDRPIQTSPLSIVERAMFGDRRDPKNQEVFLKKNFGDTNVSKITEGNELRFSVKVEDKWYDVDPGFSWDLENLGTETVKDIAQFAGRYGVRMAAAAEGFAIGSRVPGPGPIKLVSGLIGAGTAAAAGEAADIGSREVAESLGVEGVDLVENGQEFQDRLWAAFLFGATEELGGRAIGKVGELGINGLAGAIKRISNTPEGKAIAASFITKFSGKGDSYKPIARARVEDPLEAAKFDKLAIRDLQKNKNVITTMQKQNVKKVYNDLTNSVRIQGKEIGDIIKQGSRAPKGTFKTDDIVRTLKEDLKNNQFQLGDESITGVEAALSKSEKNALKVILDNSKKLEGGSTNIRDINTSIQNIDNFLYRREEAIQNKNLRRLLVGYRANLKDNMSRGLESFKPGLGKKFADINAKFKQARSLLDEAGHLSDEAKLDTYLKKVVRADGTYNAELMKEISKATGGKDPTMRILRMQSAKDSVTIFQGLPLISKKPLGAPRPVTRLATLTSAGKKVTKETIDAIPYMGHALNTLNRMGAGTKKALLKNPETLQVLGKIVAAGPVEEEINLNLNLDQIGEQLANGQIPEPQEP